MDHKLNKSVNLFLFGERTQCPVFQNPIMNVLISQYQVFYSENKGGSPAGADHAAPLRNLKYIYSHTAKGSALRKLVADVLHFVMSNASRAHPPCARLLDS